MRAAMTVAEVAKYLGVNVETVRRMVARGQLPATKVGYGKRHLYRFDPADVEAYWEANRTPKAS
jgi:excisionase family DNA binding protein